jgi:hypothetical protein
MLAKSVNKTEVWLKLDNDKEQITWSIAAAVMI